MPSKNESKYSWKLDDIFKNTNAAVKKGGEPKTV